MARRSSNQLTRERIIDAALRISLADGDTGRDVTGQTLGTELGVDRSAVWRHFRDRDDLLHATANAMMATVCARLEPSARASARLRIIWEATIAEFLRRPRIAVHLASRFASGPNMLVVINETLAALRALGVPRADVVREYRAFIDMTLAYASMLAGYSLLDRTQTDVERVRTLVAVRELTSDELPELRQAGDQLVDVSGAVHKIVLDNYLAGLEARYHHA